ncbi:hypothetical protein PWT90_09166 [Aphanocladium album]|nr:hypothetical protein PWT90_09166 [Aphanocladium album]
MNELDPNKYTVAWIAPLSIERQAAICMLDNRHDGYFPSDRGDDYIYIPGEMCGHNIIIATLPQSQEYGTGSAAALASHIKSTFRNIRFGLLVGVAAGLPRHSIPPIRDIRLGDVLVAQPDGETAAVVAYDLGKDTESGFQILNGGRAMSSTEPIVLSAIGSIKQEAPHDADCFLRYYEAMKHNEHEKGTFADPGQDQDHLYETDEHGVAKEASRAPRPDDRRTRAWYGPIGSGEKVVKNARVRDELRDRYSLLGLEMEAAGTMNRIPVGVVRGVCDYGDAHKNKLWQPYAAAMAAAYGKAIVSRVPRSASQSRETAETKSGKTADQSQDRSYTQTVNINGTVHSGAKMISGNTFNGGGTFNF